MYPVYLLDTVLRQFSSFLIKKTHRNTISSVTYSAKSFCCLLYTSDAADDMQCVDLGGRRIIKKLCVVFLCLVFCIVLEVILYGQPLYFVILNSI